MSESSRPQKPSHYDHSIEPWDVIQSWELSFWAGNTVKYICRAGRKSGNTRVNDLRKALENLNEEYRHAIEEEKQEEKEAIRQATRSNR